MLMAQISDLLTQFANVGLVAGMPEVNVQVKLLRIWKAFSGQPSTATFFHGNGPDMLQRIKEITVRSRRQNNRLLVVVSIMANFLLKPLYASRSRN